MCSGAPEAGAWPVHPEIKYMKTHSWIGSAVVRVDFDSGHVVPVSDVRAHCHAASVCVQGSGLTRRNRIQETAFSGATRAQGSELSGAHPAAPHSETEAISGEESSLS
eukprot:3101462-Rhodomonas_salina.1